MIWRCGRFPFDSRTPVIMGILNVTPDSFSDGGSYANVEEAVAGAQKMVEEGALIIDVGGESTRPGANPVPVEEELSRTIEVVKQLAKKDICVSIDTRHAEVAKAAVEAGASIINDVTGFRDPAMVEVAKGCDAGLVVMHMLGDDPRTMQDEPQYDDVVAEVCEYLSKRAAGLEAADIAHDRICLDPGPGFGKTAKQTIELMRNFQELVHLGYPTMLLWLPTRARSLRARRQCSARLSPICAYCLILRSSMFPASTKASLLMLKTRTRSLMRCLSCVRVCPRKSFCAI